MNTRTIIEPCVFSLEEMKDNLQASQERFAAGIYVTEDEMEEIWNAPLV